MTAPTLPRLGRALWIGGAAIAAFATLTPSDQLETRAGLCLICGDFAGVDALLNVLLFVPIGAGLALAGVRASRAVPGMCGGAVLIEALQLFAIAGRDASVADVLANALGGILGFIAIARLSSWLHPTTRRARWLFGLWTVFWVLVQLMGSWVLRADATRADFYGQIAPELGGLDPFSGLVLEATVNGAWIPNQVLSADQASRLRAALTSDEGTRAEVTVVARTVTAWQLPIVRIVDRQEREILLIASNETELVFGVRTRAARLRLRPALYRLRDVFSREFTFTGVEEGDTTFARVAHSADRVTLDAVTGRNVRAAIVRLSPAGSWRFIFPTQVYADGRLWNRLMDAVWLLFLLAPAGYWALLARHPGAPRREEWVMGAALALGLGVGFGVGPAVYHVAPPAWTEVFASVCGLMLGGVIASLVKKRLALSTNLERGIQR
jgi:VanZ family protein